MTAYVSVTTTLCDWDTDVDWDGTHIRLMFFSKVPGIKGGVLTGVVLLSPNTILKASNSLTKGMKLAFWRSGGEEGPQACGAGQRAKVRTTPTSTYRTLGTQWCLA